MNTKLKLRALGLAIFGAAALAHAQGTAFTYQGRLIDNSAPASGNYDLRFAIYDSIGGPTMVAGPLTTSAVAVSNGLFEVTLDFGAGAFGGAARWLDIAVRTNGNGTFTALNLRQALTPSPYAIYASTASNVVSGAVVKSLNNLKDNVTLAAGSNVTITPSGNTLTIASAGVGGSGIWSALNNNAYYNAGNVGLGTATPASKLTLLTTPNNYGFEHTDGNIRMGTFLGGSAGGGWIGTRSNHKLSFYVNDGSSSMVVDTNGNVGIGTLSPKHRLGLAGGPNWTANNWGGAVELANGAAIGWQANAGGQRFGMGHSFGGFYLFRTASDPGTTASASIYDLVVNDVGSVGIGTSTPLAGTRLHVAGTTVLESGGNGGGFISFGAPNGESGLTINGTANNRADLRFDGSTLKLVATASAGPPSSENGLAITTAGNVGIGTAAPIAKLHVETSLANKAAVYGNATGAGGSGVVGQSVSGSAVHAEGNATQAPDKGGFVKAMAYIDPFLPADQYVVRCYNSQQAGNAASTAPCGIQVFRNGPGAYEIDFGFNVEDRFVSMTTRSEYFGQYGLVAGTISYVFGNRVGVVLSKLGGFSYGTDSRFYIIVY